MPLTILEIYIPLVVYKIHLFFAYHKSTWFFLFIYFIKIYNLYFLFLYIIIKVKIPYKRKKIHSEKIVKLKIVENTPKNQNKTSMAKDMGPFRDSQAPSWLSD